MMRILLLILLLVSISACGAASEPAQPTITAPPNMPNVTYYVQALSPSEATIEIVSGVQVIALDASARLTGDAATDILAGFEALLSPAAMPTDPNLTNSLARQGLTLANVSIHDGIATITIDGELMLNGVLMDAVIRAQMLYTAFMNAPNINSIRIMVGGRNLKMILDMSGTLTDANAVYTREEFFGN